VSASPPGSESWPTAIVIDGRSQELPDPVAVEEPLEIRIGERPLAIAMRTPGHDVELAAGFLYGEGFVDERADLVELRGASECGIENVVEVRLRDGLAIDPARERAFAATSACGVCGKTSIDQLFAVGLPLLERGRPRVATSLLESLPERMRRAQQLFARTGGIHAAALFDAEGGAFELRVLREDVGRHNAVDKIAGWMFKHRVRPEDKIFYTTGRLTSEMVIKAVEMGIPVLVSRSGTTAMGLEVARRCGITLVGRAKNERFLVFAGGERIEFKK